MNRPLPSCGGNWPAGCSTHQRANANTGRVLEVASFLYALIELLAEKGVISVEELDARKAAVAPRIERRFLDRGMGLHVQ